jgi:hypothetical protein
MRMARNFAGIGALGGLFLFAGCSDPVPPAAQAGISIHVIEYDKNVEPEHAADFCPPGRHWANVPYDTTKDPSQQSQRTNTTDSTATAVNNQNGDVVTCSVTPSGSGFKVSGDATGYASSADVKRKPTTIHIRIPKISEGESDAPGTLTIQDEASINPYQSMDCSFSVSGGNLGIAPGSVWGQVHCENLRDANALGASCKVPDGSFLLENCAQ